MSVRLGYACISQVLREQGVYTGRTLTLKTAEEKGIKYAQQLALENIADLCKIIKYNEQNGIRFFRLTSNLFPHMENPRMNWGKKYDISFAANELAAAGKLAREFGHRITMHPGQFAQLGSPREEVVEQTIRDLNLHAQILTTMGMKPELGSVMIIHGGGSFGDKPATLARWEENFKKLPLETQKFIALENDDYQYTVLDLLPLCEKLRVPLCIDFFHHICHGEENFDIYNSSLLRRIMNTWKLRGIKPKCHWSNQAEGMRKGSHGDYISEIPEELLDFIHEYDCDIMCECKEKDKCVLRLLEQHFIKNYTKQGIYWTLDSKK